MATPADATLTLDFDRERMGRGLGPEWVQTAGGDDAVALAPFPNAVDRSARLQSAEVAGAEACRPLPDLAARVTSLLVDVLVSDPNTTAAIIGRDASGSPALQLSLASSASTLAVGDGAPSARADGLQVGAWVRSEIIARDDGTLWRLSDGPSGTVTEQTITAHVLDDVERVCLAVSPSSLGAAHFDNLTITTTNGG